jgi:hypothetical protein
MDQAFEQTPFVGWNWLLLQGVFYLKRIISHLAMQTRRYFSFFVGFCQVVYSSTGEGNQGYA